MTKKNYERAAKMLAWERMLHGASETATAQRIMSDFFENDSNAFNLCFEPHRFAERVDQWAIWLSARTTQTDRPVFEGEFERTTISEMNHERKQLLKADFHSAMCSTE